MARPLSCGENINSDGESPSKWTHFAQIVVIRPSEALCPKHLVITAHRHQAHNWLINSFSQRHHSSASADTDFTKTHSTISNDRINTESHAMHTLRHALASFMPSLNPNGHRMSFSTWPYINNQWNLSNQPHTSSLLIFHFAQRITNCHCYYCCIFSYKLLHFLFDALLA